MDMWISRILVVITTALRVWVVYMYSFGTSYFYPLILLVMVLYFIARVKMMMQGFQQNGEENPHMVRDEQLSDLAAAHPDTEDYK